MDIAKKRPPRQGWCITWVDQQGGELQGNWAPEEVTSQGDEHVRERWELLRWNQPTYYGATREREEESTKLPGAMQHWQEAVQRYMPPVQTWVQERWDIEKPYFPNAPDEDGIERDMEGLDLDDEEDEYSEIEEIEEDDSEYVGIR